MKKCISVFMVLCMILSCMTAFASETNASLFFNAFESEADMADTAVTLKNKTQETPGANGSAGAIRSMFRSSNATYTPMYGLQGLHFQPNVEYELSMWVKFNNAEAIKAPAVRFVTFYTNTDNSDLVVYSDSALSTEKNSTYAASDIALSATAAGWTAEDGSVEPGWHKITVPFSVQSAMLWGSYLDPEKIPDYKAQILFRFGAVDDKLANTANYMDSYVESVTAEEGTTAYYESFYMDISFDNITVKETKKEPFAVSDFLYVDFETESESGDVIYSAKKTWVSEGFGGSRGAVHLKNTTDKMGGIRINTPTRSVVGETYEFSVVAKPPADNPAALDNCYIVPLYRYLENGAVSDNGYHGWQLIYLTTKEALGDGWYRYSNTHTVAKTCTVSGATPEVYGEDCIYEFRAKATDIEYTIDELICKPQHSNTAMLGSAQVTGEFVEDKRLCATVENPIGSDVEYRVMSSEDGVHFAKIADGEAEGGMANYTLLSYDVGHYLRFDFFTVKDGVASNIVSTEPRQVVAASKPVFAASDFLYMDFETESDSGDAIYYAEKTWISEGYGGSHGAVKIKNTTSNMGGIRISTPTRSVVGETYEFSVVAKPPAENVNALDNCYVAAFYRYLVNGELSDGGYTGWQIIYLTTKEELGDGWYRYSNTHTVKNTCQISTGEKPTVYGEDCIYEFRAKATDVEYTVDELICKPQYSETEILGSAQATGTFSAGEDICATVEYTGDSTVEYRVMSSKDGVHFAKLTGGVAENNIAYYTVSDDNAGNYLRFDFITVVDGAVSNVVSTEAKYATGLKLYFTTADFDAAETLDGCVHILDPVMQSKKMTLLIVAYGKGNVMIKSEIKPLSEEEIRAGYGEISMTKPANAVRAKLFLWENLTSVMPYTTPKEIVAGLSLDLITDTLTRKAVSNTPEYEVVAEMDTGYEDVSAILYNGLPYLGEETQVFAYMGIPASASAENPVPAVVLIHGNASRLYPSWVKKWVDRGYAAIACYMVDTNESLDPEIEYAKGIRKPNGYYMDINNPLEDQYMYHAVSKAILAKNLMAAIPEVDETKIGITGISNGGMVSSYAIGVDPGFAFAVPVYNSGYLNEGGVNKGLSGNRLLWDAKNVLSNVTIPTLFINGHAATMYAIDQSTLSAKAVKNSVISFQHGVIHSQPVGEDIPEIFAFADSVVKNGSPFPTVGTVSLENNTASFRYQSENNISKIRLIYNTSGIVYNSSNSTSATEWAQPVEISVPADGNVSAVLPGGTKGFYFELTDDSCGIISTEYVELENAID
ncbi:MAG: acetylxylan esterase [Clostridia bacterium]|nr:acetylxylan esterase [Clostridia bacterium]